MGTRRLVGAAMFAGTALLLAACSAPIAGQPVSVFDDPYNVAGMAATDGPSGVRAGATPSDRDVDNSDGGDIDELSAMAVSDIEEFWGEHYELVSDNDFEPVDRLVSWDSTDRSEITVCQTPGFEFVNALYCFNQDTIAWDRGQLMPILQENFGDMGMVGVLGHEYGHAVQYKGDLITPRDSVLVGEQQADCFEGAYMRWVAEDNSSRFTLNTTDGLNKLLASVIILRDPTLSETEHEDFADSYGEHGSAFERISAFQIGFTDGVEACATIDEQEIEQRRGDLPVALPESTDGEWEITEESVGIFVNALNILFEPENPPTLSMDAADADACPDAQATQPVSYCPGTNTITVDLPALTSSSEEAEDTQAGAVVGDNTAYSMLTSRYMLALQSERGVPLEGPDTALRTACLTGVATAGLFAGVTDSNGETLTLTAGDLDEAVSGMLTNSLAASDVNGETVPSGFSRIDAFRAGVLGNDIEKCYQKFS